MPLSARSENFLNCLRRVFHRTVKYLCITKFETIINKWSNFISPLIAPVHRSICQCFDYVESSSCAHDYFYSSAVIARSRNYPFAIGRARRWWIIVNLLRSGVGKKLNVARKQIIFMAIKLAFSWQGAQIENATVGLSWPRRQARSFIRRGRKKAKRERQGERKKARPRTSACVRTRTDRVAKLFARSVDFSLTLPRLRNKGLERDVLVCVRAHRCTYTRDTNSLLI